MYFRIKDDKVYDHSDIKFDDACVYSDLCTKAEYDEHPNKYIVGDIEQEIDVPDYEEVEEEYQEQVVDEEGNPVYDEEGNPVMETKTRIVLKPIMIEVTDPETGETILVPSTHKETIIVKGLVLNPNYEQEEAERREAEFNKAFFNTSLGYIRRSVTMADGSHKDFLSDLLPVISMGVQAGQSVNILAYDAPPFDEDVTDWTEYQHQKIVTTQFISECFLQLSADFAPINKEA